MCHLGVGYSICDLAVFVRRELELVGCLMAKPQEQIFDVILNAEPA